MIAICPLTDWQESVIEKGPHKGGKSKTRMVLGADNWSYSFTLQRNDENQILVGQLFFGNLKILLPRILKDYPQALADVIKTLTAKVGHTEAISPVTNENEAFELGKMLDDTYKMSYASLYGGPYPPSVLKRIFKVDETE